MSGPMRLAAVVIAQLAIVLMFGARILDGSHSFLAPGDAFTQSYFWLTKVFNAAAAGHVALWDFTTSSGVSFIGEQQTAPLYPLSLLFGALGWGAMPQAYDHFLLVHYALAAIGTSLLLHVLGVNAIAAIAGATIFAFTGSFADRVLHQPNLFCSLAYLPYMALALVLLATKPNRRAVGAAIGAIAVAFAILAGHLYAVAIGMVCAVALATALAGRDPKSLAIGFARCATWGAGLILAGALLALPQVVATAEYLHLSYKWNAFGPTRFPHVASLGEYLLFSLDFGDFASVLGKHVDIKDNGTLFFTLTGLVAVCALPWTLRHASETQRRAALGALAIVVGTLIFALGWIYPHVPLLNQIRSPSRWLFGTGLGLAVLAALSLHGVAAFARARGLTRPAMLAYVPLVLAAGLVLLEAKRFFETRIQRPEWTQNSAHAALQAPVIEALFAAMDRHPTVYRYHAPRTLVQANLGNQRFSLATEGYRSTRSVEYHDYFDFNPRGERLRRLGVRWWVSTQEVPGLERIWTDGQVHLYERADALPVLWVLEEGWRPVAAPIGGVEWSENKVTFRLEQPIAGRIVFAQAYYPGFRAHADRMPLAVERYEALMSIEVPSPVTTLSFEYRPRWWAWTVPLAVAGWIEVLLLLGWAAHGTYRGAREH